MRCERAAPLDHLEPIVTEIQALNLRIHKQRSGNGQCAFDPHAWKETKTNTRVSTDKRQLPATALPSHTMMPQVDVLAVQLRDKHGYWYDFQL